ncbi:MAG: O-antigen ligase family protein [Brevundimonas sp.]|nr:O-antigen ligase family protein [Brevundimonas sp.]
MDLGVVALTLAFLQLNFQLVLYSALGLSVQDGASHPLLLVWVVAPMLFLGVALVRLAATRRLTSVTELAALALLLVCSVHAVFISASHGLNSGAFAFLTWATWIGVFLYLSRDMSKDWPKLVMSLLILGGILNAVPIIYESITGTALFKTATIADVTRRYGINQSISLVGLQLALGIIATCYYVMKDYKKILPILILVIQITGLILSASRGPLIYMSISLVAIATFLPKSPNRRVLVIFTVGLFVLSTVLYLLTARVSLAGDDQLGFVLSALTISDAGNSERLAYFAYAFDMWTASAWTLIAGYGSGLLSLLAVRSGGVELGAESSAIKVLLELGVLGALPFYIVVATTFRRGIQLWRSRVDDRLPYIMGAFIVIVLQLTFHETLKAWVGAMYFWMLAAAILHVGRASRRVPQSRPPFTRRARAGLHGASAR